MTSRSSGSWTTTGCSPGTYSHVSNDTFEIDDGAPISLNAPKNKGSLALAYRNAVKGFNAEARLRFNSGFPAVSAGFDGDVLSTKVVDLTPRLRRPEHSGDPSAGGEQPVRL